MSIKKDLLKEIDKKAQKIRDKRVEAANNKTLEACVFDFFRNAEEARNITGGERYDHLLFDMAKRSLLERLKTYDNRIKFSVEYVEQDPESWNEPLIRGVTLWWSSAYINKHNVDPSLYIDVSQMLFI